MPSFAEHTVTEVLAERRGLVRVRLDDGSRAYALTQLTGPVGIGDEVVVNTTAVDRGLGTGGWHVVHWNRSAAPFDEPGPGHLMKLRYTSLQVDAGAAEEDGRDVPSTLDGAPVVVAGLHSQVPVVAAAVAAARPGTRLAYVMTDGGALPLALSDVVADLAERELLVGTVTAGHAFGGDLEALNVPSALVSARHRLGAEVVVVAMGPGVAGTGTHLGYTALEVAPALDAAAWLGGRPIACVRAGAADPRERHRGISHHTWTALDAVRSEVDVAVAPGLAPPPGRHRWHEVDAGDPAALLARFDLHVTTMGRGPDADPLFFAAAAAAGTLAARWADDATEGGAP
ncbi:MAG: DUF3866 family protein [Actinobacteria bacterium]|nr:DUF3866 family protein [Actinomycetota bacterium]